MTFEFKKPVLKGLPATGGWPSRQNLLGLVLMRAPGMTDGAPGRIVTGNDAIEKGQAPGKAIVNFVVSKIKKAGIKPLR